MIDLVGFGTLTSAAKTERMNHVSNPLSFSTNSFASSNTFSSNAKDKKEYNAEELNQVAYANPFSFESLFGGSDNSTVSAFDA